MTDIELRAFFLDISEQQMKKPAGVYEIAIVKLCHFFLEGLNNSQNKLEFVDTVYHMSDVNGLTFFEQCGSNIFHMSSTLVEMLGETHVDEELSITDIQLPFPSCYFHYGKAADFIIDRDGWILEGILVSFTKISELFLDPAPLLADNIFPFSDLKDLNILRMSFVFSHPEVLEIGHNQSSSPYLEKTRVHKLDVIFKDSNEPVLLKDVNTVSAYGGSANLSEGIQFRKMIGEKCQSLIMNSILYLGLNDKDIDRQWVGTSPKQERALSSSDPRIVRETKKELKQLGIRRIHFCGMKLHEEILQETKRRGYEVRPHWRRGHMRRQAHGPKHSLRKLVWIKPMIIKREAGEIVKTTRVYDVDKNQ